MAGRVWGMKKKQTNKNKKILLLEAPLGSYRRLKILQVNIFEFINLYSRANDEFKYSLLGARRLAEAYPHSNT